MVSSSIGATEANSTTARPSATQDTLADCKVSEKSTTTTSGPDSSRRSGVATGGADAKTPGASTAEVLPGWSKISRPFRKWTMSSSDSNSNGDDPERSHNRLENVETHRSFDGDIEQLDEVRSDDQLLGASKQAESAVAGAEAVALKKNNNQDNWSHNVEAGDASTGEVIEYKVYKRRWFGLFQLVLLNIIVSWDVSLHHAETTILLILSCLVPETRWLTYFFCQVALLCS